MHRSLTNEFSESLPVTDEDNAMHNSEFGIQEEVGFSSARSRLFAPSRDVIDDDEYD